MIVLDVLGYFNRNKQNSYAALSEHLGGFTLTKCRYRIIIACLLKSDANLNVSRDLYGYIMTK